MTLEELQLLLMFNMNHIEIILVEIPSDTSIDDTIPQGYK